MYICSLRGTVNLTTVYNNESSLTCTVNQNQVHLCKLVMPLVEGWGFSALKVLTHTCTLHRFCPVAAERISPSVLCGKLHPQDVNILLNVVLQSAVSTLLLVFILLVWMYVACQCSQMIYRCFCCSLQWFCTTVPH